jgi:acyl-CoA thioester hydrolase
MIDLQEVLHTYKHQTNIQIRFKDIDKQGHVNNAVHLTYFETARTDYFKDVLRKKNNWSKTGIILASTTITYTRPILLEDDLYCFTKIARFGNKSFDIEHLLVVKTDVGFELAAHGKSAMVCFDYEKNQSIYVPEEWMESVKEFEGQ